MGLRVLIRVGLVLAAAPLFAQELSFKNKGEILKSIKVAELKTLAPLQTIKVWEPHENKEVEYRGYSARAVLDAIYGSKWLDAEELLFTCADGYQPSVPLASFKKFNSFFVTERVGQKEFTVDNRFQNEKKVPLGPLYLVWDNLKSKELKDAGANGWPYQVVGLDLVSFAERFPSLSPAAHASPEVLAGFLHFRSHCLSCHTINGEGGKKAPELNYPMSITEYLSDEMIQKWMLSPRSIRFNTTMPSFGHLAQAKQVSQEILSYLKAMQERKTKPL